MSGRSAVWLAHLPWEQGAGGSNPLAPIFYVGLQPDALRKIIKVHVNYECVEASVAALPMRRDLDV